MPSNGRRRSIVMLKVLGLLTQCGAEMTVEDEMTAAAKLSGEPSQVMFDKTRSTNVAACCVQGRRVAISSFHLPSI